MGKNTLKEIGKLLMVSLLSILISTMATRRTLLDKKVDKTEFNEYKKEQNKEDLYIRTRIDAIYNHLIKQ